MAFLKAKEEFNNYIGTPSDELCMPEAAEVAVLCQGWLMISESSLPPPGCAAPGEGQPEAAHIIGLLESCLPTLGRAAPGEAQPEAAQYQGGLRTASEELCLPTGCVAWRRSRLPEKQGRWITGNFSFTRGHESNGLFGGQRRGQQQHQQHAGGRRGHCTMPGLADDLRVMLANPRTCCAWRGSTTGCSYGRAAGVVLANPRMCCTWRESTRGCSISVRAEDGLGGVMLAPRMCGVEEEPVVGDIRGDG
jgi:hypothetical protein